MRADVKLGLVTSLAVVAAVAWYFSGDESADSLPVEMNERTLSELADVIDGSGADSEADESFGRPPIETDVITWNLPDDDTSESLDVTEYEDDAPRETALADDSDTSSILNELFNGRIDDGDEEEVGPLPADDVKLADSGATDDAESGTRRSGIPLTAQSVEEAAEEQPAATRVTPPRRKAERRPAALPVDAKTAETHTVASGDTMSSIAQRYFGTQSAVASLIKANPHIIDAQSLAVGTVVIIPEDESSNPAPAAEAESESGAPTKGSYVVRSGDTLSKIARKTLGEAKRWKDVYALNSKAIGDDPGRLKVGLVLKLPPK